MGGEANEDDVPPLRNPAFLGILFQVALCALIFALIALAVVITLGKLFGAF